jgi:hypothetical protein
MINTRIMRIEDLERKPYVEVLRSLYGKQVAAERDFVQSRQLFIEQKRHGLNARFVSNVSHLDLYPKRLLISATQKCTFNCAHCWVFASPRAGCSLDFDGFKAIYDHLLSDTPPEWTITGGEFFALPYWSDILGSFPVQCLYTNAFWGYPAENCMRQIQKLRKELENNPGIDRKRFTMILSYDRYHVDGAGRFFPLSIAVAGIIDQLYKSVPDASVRISHTVDPRDIDRFDPVLAELEKSGFQIRRTRRSEKNKNIRTISFAYSRGNGPVKELFVDMFPPTPVCRGLLMKNRENEMPVPELTDKIAVIDSLHCSRAFHQFTVGPDGGVAIYETLYAPPVPFYLGDLVHEHWKEIEERIRHDPIIITLKHDGMRPFMTFMKKYEPKLLDNIAADIQTVQQLLYLIFLKPERRLLLNAYLLNRLLKRSVFNSHQVRLDKQMSGLIETEQSLERMKRMFDIYGIN